MSALSGDNSTAGGLTSDFIIGSNMWERLGPPAVKSRIERALTGLTDPTTSTLSRGSSDSEKDEEDQNIIRLTSAVERLETACASMVLPEEGVLIS